MRTPDIDIRRISENHVRVIVTVRGRCYACAWANDVHDDPITQEQALDAWKNDRTSFLPYNCIIVV